MKSGDKIKNQDKETNTELVLHFLSKNQLMVSDKMRATGTKSRELVNITKHYFHTKLLSYYQYF